MLCCSEFVFEDMLVYNNSEYLLPLLTPADPFVFVLERCSVTFVVLFIVGYLSRSPICCFCLREWNVKVHKTVNVNAPTDLVYLFFFLLGLGRTTDKNRAEQSGTVQSVTALKAISEIFIMLLLCACIGSLIIAVQISKVN